MRDCSWKVSWGQSSKGVNLYRVQEMETPEYTKLFTGGAHRTEARRFIARVVVLKNERLAGGFVHRGPINVNVGAGIVVRKFPRFLRSL